MITLYICTVDRFTGNVWKDLGRIHRGYVIEVFDGIETGHLGDEANPILKIIHVDMTLEQGIALAKTENRPVDDIEDKDNERRRRRMVRLDLDTLPAHLIASINDTSMHTTLNRADSVLLRNSLITINKLPPGTVIRPL